MSEPTLNYKDELIFFLKAVLDKYSSYSMNTS